MIRSVTLSLLVCTLLLAVAFAGDQTKGALCDADKNFVTKAALGGLTEVELSRLAIRTLTNDDVKKFAEQMVSDHSKVNAELTQLVKSKGCDVPTELDQAHKEIVEKLSKAAGAGLDKMYVKQMLSDHVTTVADFQKAGEECKDTDLKSFVTVTLPTLQSHLQHVKAISEKMDQQAER